MLRILSAPVLYALELTAACNNRCVGCLSVPREHEGGGKERPSTPTPLGMAAWRTILKQLARHAQRFKLTGGEPTQHPDFIPLVQHIDTLGVEFVLLTNGRWIEPGPLLDILGNLRHLVGALISLHGARSHSHEAFTRVPGSFGETVANIRRAAARGVPFAISTVLSCANVGEIPAIVELAEQLGADHVVFNRYLGPAVGGITPSPPELAPAVREIETLREQKRAVRFGNCIPQCFMPNDSAGCLAAVAYCAVDFRGTVRPCTHSSIVAGNLLEQPIEAIWHSPAMESFRNAISPVCHKCTAFPTCHGGCKALAIEQGLETDPLARPSSRPASPSPSEVRLHPALRPLAHFVVRREEWGLALLSGSRVLPVRPEAVSILQMMDGNFSLSDIRSNFGSAGVSLVGALHRKGLISLE